VAVVVSGSLEQDISIKPTIESAEMRVIDFFIVRIPSLKQFVTARSNVNGGIFFHIKRFIMQ
jgi:hypothetical protein